MDASGRFKVCFDWNTKTVSDGTGMKDHDVVLENLVGFENGAYVSVSLGGNGGAAVITEFNGLPTAETEILESETFISQNNKVATIQKEFGYTKNADSGKGLLVTGTEGASVISKKAFDLSAAVSSLIELQVVDQNGVYYMKDITVSLIDANNPENRIVIKMYRNVDDIKLGFYYESQSKTDIDANWAGYSVYEKCGGGSAAADKRFSVHFDWETKTISDGTGIENHNMVLENFTGFENGAYISVDIGVGGGAAVITKLFDNENVN